MGRLTDWTPLDQMESALAEISTVGELVEQNRYGLFSISYDILKLMSNIELGALFAKYIPLEMRGITYDDDGERYVLEIMGVSKSFKPVGENESPPFYNIGEG